MKKTEEVKENAVGTETETIVKDEKNNETTTDANLKIMKEIINLQWRTMLRIKLLK